MQNFCDRYGISLSSDFWNLGNLKKKISKPWFNIYNGDSVEYIGSDSEKLKYENITDLIPKISEFNDIVDYFAKIDNLYNASFFIENNGTTYDEDIDIRIFIEKGHIVEDGPAIEVATHYENRQ